MKRSYKRERETRNENLLAPRSERWKKFSKNTLYSLKVYQFYVWMKKVLLVDLLRSVKYVKIG